MDSGEKLPSKISTVIVTAKLVRNVIGSHVGDLSNCRCGLWKFVESTTTFSQPICQKYATYLSTCTQFLKTIRTCSLLNCYCYVVLVVEVVLHTSRSAACYSSVAQSLWDGWFPYAWLPCLLCLWAFRSQKTKQTDRRTEEMWSILQGRCRPIVYRVSKPPPYYFLNNSVKNKSIGTVLVYKILKKFEVRNFAFCSFCDSRLKNVATVRWKLKKSFFSNKLS